MKNDLATAFLNCVLLVLVLLSVFFGYLTIRREPRVAGFATLALQDNNNMMKVNAILNDAAVYNASARSPELARILQAAQQKPATH